MRGCGVVCLCVGVRVYFIECSSCLPSFILVILTLCSVCIWGHFYNAITARGMLWFLYDFYAAPYAPQLSKSATMQRYCNMFYCAASRCPWKHTSDTKKEGEKTSWFWKELSFLGKLTLESVWLFIRQQGASLLNLTAYRKAKWLYFK